jgi:hypothetical protein
MLTAERDVNERATAALQGPRRVRPVVGWAIVGALFIAVQAWAYGGWIISGEATRTAAGPTPIPNWMEVGHTIFEIGGPLAALTMIWFFLVRPWRRTGRLTLDGMFLLAFALSYWQDLLLDYFQPVYVYNAHLFNLGAWNLHIPGWMSPNGNLVAEPLLAVGPMYVYAVFGSVVLSNFCMRKARVRWPRLGNFGLLAGTFLCFFVFDMIVETPMLSVGLFSFPGAIRGITLFDGNYYQFPLSEAFFMSCIWTAWSAVRFFRDDKGRTIAERGVDDLAVSERSRTGVRFLAVVGITNAILLVLYMIPVAILGLYGGQWPDDVTNRSYFVNGQCGPGTTYACPAPGVPIARRDSSRVGPDGRLVPKDGTSPTPR